MTILVIGVGVALMAALGALLYYASVVPHSEVFGPVITRGVTAAKQIALTFDDGPMRPFTEQVLSILKEKRVTATFFVCGLNAERFPELVRRIRDEGHSIGNHTYSHPYLCLLTRRGMVQEIDQTQEILGKLAGSKPQLFRPPYGIRWFWLHGILRERGLKLIQWSDAGFDWKCHANEIAQNALAGVAPGSVILLHDGRRVDLPEHVNRAETVRALPRIIDKARSQGFEFVPIESLLLPL